MKIEWGDGLLNVNSWICAGIFGAGLRLLAIPDREHEVGHDTEQSS